MVALAEWIQPEETDSEPKTRVGDFFGSELDRVGETDSQVVECDWEKTFVIYDSRRSASLARSNQNANDFGAWVDGLVVPSNGGVYISGRVDLDKARARIVEATGLRDADGNVVFVSEAVTKFLLLVEKGEAALVLNSQGINQQQGAHLWWDPTGTQYDNTGVALVGVTNLLHEAVHVVLALENEAIPHGITQNGIPLEEIRAVQLENQARSVLGRPLRTTYGNQLPDILPPVSDYSAASYRDHYR